MTRKQRRASILAMIVGVTTTTLVIVAQAAGLLDWLELRTLDYRFRYANAIVQDPDIVCIDIDDGALELVGRWPWPRFVQTALVAIPAELGAKAILVDLTLIDPEPLAVDPPADADVAANLATFTPSEDTIRFSDRELRAAIAEAGNVYLGFLYDRLDLLHSPRLYGGADSVAGLVRAQYVRSAADVIAELEPSFRAEQDARADHPEQPTPRLDVLQIAAVMLKLEADVQAEPAAPRGEAQV